MTAVSVPIEEGHVIILHIPAGVQNKPRENVAIHKLNTHQPTWMILPSKMVLETDLEALLYPICTSNSKVTDNQRQSLSASESNRCKLPSVFVQLDFDRSQTTRSLLHLKRDFRVLFDFALYVVDVHKNALPRIQISDKSESFRIIKEGNDSDSRCIVWKLFFLWDSQLNVFRIDFLALSRIWWSICDIAKLIDISNHAVVVQA